MLCFCLPQPMLRKFIRKDGMRHGPTSAPSLSPGVRFLATVMFGRRMPARRPFLPEQFSSQNSYRFSAQDKAVFDQPGMDDPASARGLKSGHCGFAQAFGPERSQTTVRGTRHRILVNLRTNAVSERFISVATDCIHAAGRVSLRMQIAAGFPSKGLFVKAST
jgi:hypothetical protein